MKAASNGDGLCWFQEGLCSYLSLSSHPLFSILSFHILSSILSPFYCLILSSIFTFLFILSFYSILIYYLLSPLLPCCVKFLLLSHCALLWTRYSVCQKKESVYMCIVLSICWIWRNARMSISGCRECQNITSGHRCSPHTASGAICLKKIKVAKVQHQSNPLFHGNPWHFCSIFL